MSDVDEWRRLCDALGEDDSVWEAVKRALDDGGDPWEAFLDGLDEAGALAYLQSDDTGMELSDALAQLPRVFRLQPDLDEVSDIDSFDEATAAADRTLRAGGYRLLRFVEAGDEASRPLVVVPVEKVHDVEDAALALGGEVVLPG